MTTRRRFGVHAPGKVMIAGEYAVLDGATALVMAVDRWVHLAPSDAPSVGLVASAREAAARHLGVPVHAGGWTADSSALRNGVQKLGVGSSAAVTVASVASVYAEAGFDVEHDGRRLDMWGVARAAHDAHQGEPGSGADIAAALFGGRLAMRPPQGSGLPVLDSWLPPPGVVLWFVWTGQEARTPALVGAFREWQSREPAAWSSLLGRMAAVCETLATADDAAAFVEGIHRYGALLAELGRAAGIDIVPESAARIVDAASSRGGAAKPSGAGGGDLVVAAFPPGVDDRPFRDQVEALGGRFVPLSVAARGVHLERVVAAESVERGG